MFEVHACVCVHAAVTPSWCYYYHYYYILILESHDGISQHKSVCKKYSGVCGFLHSRDSLFAATWSIHSLVECVGNAKICGVSRVANQTLQFST